jgi:hypothetical protein
VISEFGMLVVIALLMSLLITPVLSQEDNDTCPTIASAAITLVDTACQETGRNQACYGNLQLAATPRANVTDFIFEQSGDIVDVVDIESLELQPLDVDDTTWGIALMKLQANLPDTMPGQNVTVLLFGDVSLQNAVEADEPAAILNATASSGVNLRGGPGTDYAVVGGLSVGDVVIADGRNEANDWLRVQFDNNGIGWVFAPLVTLDGDIDALIVRSAGDVTTSYGPMQAFYFRSGVGDTACAQAPNGMLIQTPQGVGEVTLSVNEVTISMGSTVFFQTTANTETLVISTIEGRAEVTADEVTQTVEAGQQISVQLDENLMAVAPPSKPEAFDSDEVQELPYAPLPESLESAEEESIAATDTEEPDGSKETMMGDGLVGNWEATDEDGSHMTLSIQQISEGVFDVYIYDAGATACSPDDGVTLLPAEGEGQGTVDSSGALHVTLAIWCIDPYINLGNYSPIVVYDAETNTLNGFRVVMSRQ